ncbi:Pyrimidine-specific ribonucleoside hydrolase RihA [Microbacterium lemovicicum]|uniref:Pyrimidine-specific ribonucleoside hydrolase RihA n=1 Tax=Microbacterium lemovicicum TaxID=1072463 RepID=A0A3Q9J4J8_9MICO|nr:nucleoside hydrolase [Microbacterium lemovicicum]AZS38250.1 Pyrimidine-specific ribonucleoside hydrolase RihA [Microbacterium lemovicicum]
MIIQDTRRRRVIIDSDVKNEADDQFAVVHALLSPSLDICGIIPAHFGTGRSATSMQDSRAELEHLLRLMDRTGGVRVENGSPSALTADPASAVSDGARLIVEEARRTDAGPLFISFLGPLTDMAAALLLAPDIAATDTTVIWIGGPPYGDREWRGTWPEFNLRNDIRAANVVFASGIRIWQVPANVYRLVSVGYAELRRRVEPHGALGAYLAQAVVDFNTAHHGVPVESRSLGDSPAVALMIDPWCAVFRAQPPVRFTDTGHCVPAESGSAVSVVEEIDVRFLLEDMFAKLAEFGESAAAR